MAWKVVPFSSITIFFSWITSRNSMIFGPSLVACSWGCTKGGATRSTFWRGKFSSAASAGVANAMIAAAALIRAALRVNMGGVLYLELSERRHHVPIAASEFALRQASVALHHGCGTLLRSGSQGLCDRTQSKNIKNDCTAIMRDSPSRLRAAC